MPSARVRIEPDLVFIVSLLYRVCVVRGPQSRPDPRPGTASPPDPCSSHAESKGHRWHFRAGPEATGWCRSARPPSRTIEAGASQSIACGMSNRSEPASCPARPSDLPGAPPVAACPCVGRSSHGDRFPHLCSDEAESGETAHGCPLVRPSSPQVQPVAPRAPRIHARMRRPSGPGREPPLMPPASSPIERSARASPARRSARRNRASTDLRRLPRSTARLSRGR